MRKTLNICSLNVLLAPFLAIFLVSANSAVAQPDAAPTKKEARSVVRVQTTCQAWDFQRPWMKKAPISRSAVGAVLSGGRVLVTAELVANQSMVELGPPQGTEKVPGKVLAVDPEANLALVAPVDPAFLKNFVPMELSSPNVVGDRLEVWQLESNGTLLGTNALLTNVAVQPYPLDGTLLLAYQLTSSIQNREGSFALPLSKNGKLAGFSTRFDPRTQNLQAVPVEIIRHFLEATEKPEFRAFPKAGISFASTRDPMFRRHIGLDGKHGVYVTEVQPDGPGARAGIREGDILLSLAGKEIDRDGNYEHPIHGKVSLIHLITGEHFDGDKIPAQILRDGQKESRELVLAARPASSFVSPPFMLEQPPRFLVVGGLLFQELSRPYLREFGNNWDKTAPQRLDHYNR